jgi:Pyruvate/2-oxoacid:ferredoxin oxidoreductase delta subunit
MVPGTTIYYFSGTGNSLAVARAIAEKLGDTKLISMARPDAANLSPDTRRVGLIFPVYVFGLPLIVARFIKQLKIPKDSYLFAVAVNGGMPCATLNQAARLCSEQDMLLSSGFAVTMVDNCISIAGAISLEKQKIRFEKAGRKIDDICAAIEKRERSIYPGWPLVNWLFSRMYRRWIVKAPGKDKQFTADSNCNGCGLCASVCPVRNIKMNERLPAWQHHCEQCLACLHWCPNKAIQWGKHTTGRIRYHHPDVTVKDITV